MPVSVSKKSHFGDVVMRALLNIECGQAQTATFSLSTGAVLAVVTVGAAWNGDVYSWRLVHGAQAVVSATDGEEVYGGLGSDQDVLYAAARLAYSFAEAANGGSWTLLD